MSATKKPKELPTLSFARPADFGAWLAEHHASSPGVWLKLAKKSSGVVTIDYAQALDEALCWGWIDGQKKSHDEGSWLQKFTRRSARSIWSKVNREKVAALLEAGRMRPPGLAEIDRAKKDGRWEAAYDSPSRAAVPEDLARALAANPLAEAFFATLNSQNRYAILFRLQTAKKAETRARRLAAFVEMLSKHEKLYP